MAADTGMFGAVVATAGSIAAAAAALGTTWKGRSKWEPDDQDVSKGPQRVGGLVAAVGLVGLWVKFRNADAATSGPLLKYAIILACAAVLGLVIYGTLLATLIYHGDKDRKRRIIGGFVLTPAASKARNSAKAPTVQELLAKFDYDPDKVWPRFPRAIAKQTFVIAYLLLSVTGTFALTSVSLYAGAATTGPSPSEHWMLKADAPPVCSLSELASFDVAELTTPSAYSKKIGKEVIINPEAYDVCGTEHAAWAIGNCWYQVATNENLAVVDMFNGGSAKTKCKLSSYGEWQAEPPARSASVESLIYSVGLIGGRCAAYREPCGRNQPCDETRVKAYDKVATLAKHLLQASNDWRSWELKELEGGASYEAEVGNSEVLKGHARTSRDAMSSKLLQLEKLLDQLPYGQTPPIELFESEITAGQHLATGDYCVPCLFSDRTKYTVCRPKEP